MDLNVDGNETVSTALPQNKLSHTVVAPSATVAVYKWVQPLNGPGEAGLEYVVNDFGIVMEDNATQSPNAKYLNVTRLEGNSTDAKLEQP